MGSFHVACMVENITHRERQSLIPKVLVDTGSEYSWVPEDVLSGIGADRFCFGNTIKRERDIAWAHAIGVDLFAFDSVAELDKLARAAPGARVFCPW